MCFFFEGGQVLELFDAWAAPGGPYVDIDHFAFEGFYRIFQIFNCGVARQNVIVLVVDAAVLEAEVFINARFKNR